MLGKGDAIMKMEQKNKKEAQQKKKKKEAQRSKEPHVLNTVRL